VAEIVNLRRRRRQAARAAARQAGDANAARHGRTKAEAVLAQARAEKAARDLEAHRREATDAEPPSER
jgi:hypothetical protein